MAGALLAETNFRTQIEADIRPFRGLLLGLFFVTTGTSIDTEVTPYLLFCLLNDNQVALLHRGLHLSIPKRSFFCESGQMYLRSWQV